MAGNYPDAPSWRMAWDRDGTVAAKVVGGVITQLAGASLIAMNDEGSGFATIATTGEYTTTNSLVVIFPEPRDLDGYYVAIDHSENALAPNAMYVEVSLNSTNGIDGTWTNIATITGGIYMPRTSDISNYRSAISSTTQLAIRGFRLRTVSGGWNVRALHLYGEPAPGANQNRLEMWHPTADEKLPPAYFDWGNTPRSSSADRQFRVKNLSATQTAAATRVAFDVLTDGVPSVPAQHTLSYGGGSFLPQVNVGDLAPGAISGLVTIRRVTPSNALLSLWAFRVFAESTSWS